MRTGETTMMRGGSDHMTTRAAGTSHARTSAGDGAHPHDAGDMPSVARAVARVLALACFFATTPAYSPSVMAISHHDSADVTGWFAKTFLAVALACSVALLAHGARPVGGAARGGVATTGRRTAGLAACVAYVIGSGGYAVLVALFGAEATGAAAPAHALAVALAAIGAMGFVPVCARWGRAFRDVELQRVIAAVAVALALAEAVDALCAAVPRAWAALVWVVALLVGVIVPAATPSDDAAAERDGNASRVTGADETRGAVAAPEAGATAQAAAAPEMSEADGVAAGGLLRPFLSVMGSSLVGMAISSFTIGVAPTLVCGGALTAQHLAVPLAALVTLPFLVVTPPRPVGAFSRDVLIPAAATVTIAVCALPSIGSGDAGAVVANALFSLVGFVAIAVGCAVSNAHEFPRAVVFATLVGTYCLAAIAGIGVGAALDTTVEEHAATAIVLAVAYCGVIVVRALVWGWRGTATSDGAATGEAREDADIQTVGAPVESLDERVGRLAREADLTPRETEIFGYLAHGHGRTYISETLLISKNTVYTHMRNIYRKLGVGSREEVVQLVSQDGPADGDARPS